MTHLLSLIDTHPQLGRPNPPLIVQTPETHSTPSKRKNASPNTALVVENDESLVKFFKRCLEHEDYEATFAANSEDGLRLYRDCAAFNVVLISYSVPRENGFGIDCLGPQRHGTELAMSIREINRSQPMIIVALDYRSASEVPRPSELMDIPLLTDISNFQLRHLLAKIEIDRAMGALTDSQLVRLKRFADYRVRGLGRAARGRTGQDLLSEACLRTLIGAGSTREGRHWNKYVDFVWHLTGAMRSISNGWKRQFEAAVRRKEPEAYLIPTFPIQDAVGREYSPLSNVASGDAGPEQCLIEKDEEDRVLAMSKDDAEATQVLQGLLDGLKKDGIMSKYGLDENQYAAVVKRILKLVGANGGRKR
ncbi:MAG: response regulator [Candidatus Sulfotelmatobacter sp.]